RDIQKDFGPSIFKKRPGKISESAGYSSSQSAAARTKANSKVRRKPVDWNSVLKQLPGSFAVGNATNLAKIKSRNYMHHVLAKWIKQRKVKRVEPGKYQKL